MDGFDFSVVFAYFLVILALLFSIYKKLGLEKEIFISSLRGFFQLFILSFFLIYILASENTLYIFLAYIVMILFASYTAKSRVNLPKYSFFIALISISIPSSFVLGSLILVGTLKFEANIIIPIAGMVLGNALNVYTLTIDRLKNNITNSIGKIEGMLSLGVKLEESTKDESINAIKASLHPIINNLQTIGIVFIPGMMSGMIIAGASPLYAFSFQMTIMYMLLTVSLLCSIIASKLSYKFLVYR